MKNKTRHFRLTDATVFENLCKHILDKMTECQQSEEYVFVSVDVGEEERARSLRQNALYWSWLTLIAQAKECSKDYAHTILKRNLLTRIYMKSDLQMVDTVKAMAVAKENMTKQQYERLAMNVARLISTKKPLLMNSVST